MAMLVRLDLSVVFDHLKSLVNSLIEAKCHRQASIPPPYTCGFNQVVFYVCGQLGMTIAAASPFSSLHTKRTTFVMKNVDAGYKGQTTTATHASNESPVLAFSSTSAS